MVTITVKITIVLIRIRTVLTHQLPTTMTTTNKTTPTMKEKVIIIVPAKCYAITPTPNLTIILKDDFTKSTIDNLAEIPIDRTTSGHKTNTTIPIVIKVNTIVVKIANALKQFI